MKKKLLAGLLISAMVLAGSTMVRAEDMFETNTEETLEMSSKNESDITENPNEGTVIVAEKLTFTEKFFPDEIFREYLKDTFDKDGDGYLSNGELQDIINIDISNKGIKSLEGVSRFTYLKNLNCDNNQLTTLEVGGCLSLESLSCKGNQLTSLNSMLTLNSLQFLDCSDNKLTELNLSRMPHLTSLYCENNPLVSLDVSVCPNLSDLRWDKNGSPNEITEDEIVIDEDHFPDEIFREYVKENCDTDGNGGLSQDEIETVTSIGIRNQDIAKGFIKDLKGIELFTNLQWLYCAGNQLTSLDVSKNLELGSLSCANNQLKDLDLSNNKKLVTLQCNGNQLTSLDISNNLYMENLDCSDNQLSNLDVAKNSKLLLLWCANNQLGSLDVSENKNLVSLKCRGNHLADFDLSLNKTMPIRNSDDSSIDDSWHTSTGGAYVTPQNITASVVSINGIWTVNLAIIVGKENLSRVTLVTDGAELSTDGTVTFSGSNIPTELVYNYDTKNPAEDTPMTVHVALTQKNIDDQTGKDVTVDTGDLDLDSICKNHNLNLSANIEIILSQDTPSKEDLDKLTQAAGANGYSITATYEILMSLFSNGQKIADITDNFGRIKLTFQVNASLAGQSAIVYQLHNNSQVIVHDGLTVNTDGTVTITVDKFSSFAVAVKQSSGNTGSPNTDQSGINKPDADKPDTNQPVADKTDTDQSDTSKTGGNPSNTNQVAPMTGDSANLVFWMIVVIAAFITGILSRKRYHKS